MKTKYAHLIETGKPAKVALTGYSSRPVNALAGIPLGLLHPSGKSTVRSARTHAPALRVCVQIALGRPSVAGTPADKRFGSRASDISKINFNGARQTGSTPHDYAVMVASRSGSGSPQLGRRMSSLTSMALRAMPTPPGIECSWRRQSTRLVAGRGFLRSWAQTPSQRAFAAYSNCHLMEANSVLQV
jgi:hypothetical protein